MALKIEIIVDKTMSIKVDGAGPEEELLMAISALEQIKFKLLHDLNNHGEPSFKFKQEPTES